MPAGVKIIELKDIEGVKIVSFVKQPPEGTTSYRRIIDWLYRVLPDDTQIVWEKGQIRPRGGVR